MLVSQFFRGMVKNPVLPVLCALFLEISPMAGNPLTISCCLWQMGMIAAVMMKYEDMGDCIHSIRVVRVAALIDC